MASNNEKGVKDYSVKVLGPTEVEEVELPSVVGWDKIPDRPQTLSALDPSAGEALENAIVDIGDIQDAIDGLGALAYEDLVDTLQIAAGAVTNAKIAVDAVQGAVIAASAITETKIASDAVSAAKIQAGAIVAGKIAANAIVASNIQAGQIDATKMNVSQLSAITANLGTVNAGSINGVTITGGVLQTAATGNRVLISGSSNDIQFLNGATIYATLEPFTLAGSNGARIKSNSGRSYMAVQETGGGNYTAAIGTDGNGTPAAAVFMFNGEMSVYGDDSVYIETDSVGIYLDSSEILLSGDVRIDLGSMTVDAGQMYFTDGSLNMDAGFVNLARMTGTQADARGDSRNGSMYYRSSDHVIRVMLNGTWRTITTS